MAYRPNFSGRKQRQGGARLGRAIRNARSVTFMLYVHAENTICVDPRNDQCHKLSLPTKPAVCKKRMTRRRLMYVVLHQERHPSFIINHHSAMSTRASLLCCPVVTVVNLINLSSPRYMPAVPIESDRPSPTRRKARESPQ